MMNKFILKLIAEKYSTDFKVVLGRISSLSCFTVFSHEFQRWLKAGSECVTEEGRTMLVQT